MAQIIKEDSPWAAIARVTCISPSLGSLRNQVLQSSISKMKKSANGVIHKKVGLIT
jgi:hypothetical protein